MKKHFLLSVICLLFFLQPYSQILVQESFDGTTFAPTGWYNTRMAPSFSTTLNLWDRVTSGTNPAVTPHSGAGMARFNSLAATSNTETELGTMALNFSGTSRYRVRFWMFRSNAVNAFDRLDVYAALSPSAAWGPKIGSVSVYTNRTPAETANGWYEYIFDVPANVNYTTTYIIFRAIGAIGLPIYIDDVVVETITCHKPLSPLATSNTTNTATLSWTAPAAGTPTSYEWEIRTAGSAGTGATGLVLSGTTPSSETSVNVTGLTTGTNYQLYVRSVCGTDKSTWTDVTAFKTQCALNAVPYFENFDGSLSVINTCTNVENVNGGGTWSVIAAANLGTNANSSPNVAYCQFGGTSNLPQNDWFFTTPLLLEAGKCYELYFSYRSLYTNYPTAFEVKFGSSPRSSAMTSPAIFSNLSFIDVNYKTGACTFTVSQNGTYFIGFHHIGSDGGSLIIDDMGVKENIGAPADINTIISATSATLNWNAPNCGTANDYEWELRTSGAAGSGNTGLLSTGNGNVFTATFNGLTENTKYTFYVRSKNGTLTSAWSEGVIFTTNCSVRALPYIQNFDAVIAPALPACILKQDITIPYNSWNTWQNVSFERPNSSPNCMRFGTNNSNGTGNNWFFTPPFAFTAGKSYRLTFYYRNDIYARPEKLEVKYGMGPNASSMISAAIFTNTDIRNSLFKKAVIDFVPPQNGNYNIGFRGFSDALQNFVFIDDIKVEETPACDVVRDIQVTNITAATATIKWGLPAVGAPEGYEWELRTSGAAGSGSTGLLSTGTLAAGSISLNVNGLTSNTTHFFYIRSNCGGTGISEWVSYAFASACVPASIPYSENFNSVTTPNLPGCTRIEEINDHYKWYTTSGISNSAPFSLYHPNSFSSPFDDWFFTAPLQLTGGVLYRLTFYTRQEVAGNSDALEVRLGNFAESTAMNSTPVYSNSNITNTSFQLVTVDFFTPVTGVYYLGFRSMIGGSPRGLFIDDINVVANVTTSVRDFRNNSGTIIKQVYPNPVKDKLVLSVNADKDFGRMNAIVHDNSGRVLKSFILQLNGAGNYTIDIKELASGVYMIETEHEKTGVRSMSKVVKQ
jgi:Fibronectin type III domain/Secretion system C-terminal sorting domain